MDKKKRTSKLVQQLGYDIRQGIAYQWQKYALLFIVYVVCVISFITRCKMNKHIDTYTSGDMVMWMLKGVKRIQSGSMMIDDISPVYIFPNIIIAYITGNYVIKDLYGYGKSILIKAGSRINWWFSKCMWCVMSALVCYGMMYLVIIIAGLCTGSLSFNPTSEVCCYVLHMDRQLISECASITKLMCGVMCTSIIMTITINVVQITIGLIVSPLIGYMAVIALLVIAAFVDNPAVITLYCMAVRSGSYMPSGYKLLPAIIIMGLIILVCVIAGAVYSSRMDIISKKADWQNPD